jgi:thiamine-phosphate pyrophosphorylase
MDLRLIVITDVALAAPKTIEDVVRAALEAGAPAIQLRDKQAEPAELYRQALRLGELARQYDALLIINDRLDVALATDAHGVHLGPHDLPVAAARAAARRAGRPDLIIGASTDDPDRARHLAAEGADYIGCGAVYGTRSKPDVGTERIGTQGLARVARAVDIPVIAIGGITPANVGAALEAGARGAAVIGAVMCADDPGLAVRLLLGANDDAPARSLGAPGASES